jgi:hypothetical protein
MTACREGFPRLSGEFPPSHSGKRRRLQLLFSPVAFVQDVQHCEDFVEIVGVGLFFVRLNLVTILLEFAGPRTPRALDR